MSENIIRHDLYGIEFITIFSPETIQSFLAGNAWNDDEEIYVSNEALATALLLTTSFVRHSYLDNIPSPRRTTMAGSATTKHEKCA